MTFGDDHRVSLIKDTGRIHCLMRGKASSHHLKVMRYPEYGVYSYVLKRFGQSKFVRLWAD